MYSIASLHDFRRHLGLTETDADADADLRQALEKASHLIESLTQRRYCPALETRRLTIDGSNPRELILPEDLLDLISIESSHGILSKDTVRRLPIRADLPASVLILNEGGGIQRRIERQRRLGLARPLDPSLAEERRSDPWLDTQRQRRLDNCRRC